MRELDQMAIIAADDPEKLNAFIQQNEFYILKIASKISRRYISKNDDEWSVALCAFSDAIKKYNYEKGSFLSFAELLIHRSLVDFFRVEGRHDFEEPVGWLEEKAIVEKNDNSLKLEIEAITEVLESYGFSFMDLVECSPKAGKTKESCGKAVTFLLEKVLLIEEIRNSKQLPIKIIEKNTGVPRKILERHRKYIIAAAEILHGDYPYLSDYLSNIRKG